MRSPVGQKDLLFVNNMPNLKDSLSKTGCASRWPVGWDSLPCQPCRCNMSVSCSRGSLSTWEMKTVDQTKKKANTILILEFEGRGASEEIRCEQRYARDCGVKL